MTLVHCLLSTVKKQVHLYPPGDLLSAHPLETPHVCSSSFCPDLGFSLNSSSNSIPRPVLLGRPRLLSPWEFCITCSLHSLWLLPALCHWPFVGFCDLQAKGHLKDSVFSVFFAFVPICLWVVGPPMGSSQALYVFCLLYLCPQMPVAWLPVSQVHL